MITRYYKPIPKPVIVWLMAIVLALPSPSYSCCTCSHDELRLIRDCCNSTSLAPWTNAIGCCDCEATDHGCSAPHCGCLDNCACHRADGGRASLLKRLVADEDVSANGLSSIGPPDRHRETYSPLPIDTSTFVTTSALERCIDLSRFQL